MVKNTLKYRISGAKKLKSCIKRGFERTVINKKNDFSTKRHFSASQ
jgi:hypothetical protein